MNKQLKLDSYQYTNVNRPELAAYIPPNCSGLKILEIGCGDGSFSKYFDTDCEYFGVEPSVAASIKARELLSQKRAGEVFTGTYEETYNSIPDGYFDLVICNDVIEHMNDHDMFFSSILTKLTENGKVIGSIPNIRYYKQLRELLFKKDWKYQDSGILDRTHLRFFTRKSLERTFNENGFNIERIFGINGIFSSKKKLKRVLKIFQYLLPVSILGFDTQYQQFYFVITPKK